MVKLVPSSIPTISRQISDKEFNFKKIQVKAAIKRIDKRSTIEKTSWIWQHFKDFSANTALHGYNHIVQNDTTKCER